MNNSCRAANVLDAETIGYPSDLFSYLAKCAGERIFKASKPFRFMQSEAALNRAGHQREKGQAVIVSISPTLPGCLASAPQNRERYVNLLSAFHDGVDGIDDFAAPRSCYLPKLDEAEINGQGE